MSNQQDPTWRIFHKRYKVRVPGYALVSEAEAALIGTFTSGDADLDRQIRNAFTPIFLTPVGMCIYYMEGIPIQIINTKEAGDIYHDISTHLERWSTILDTRYNVSHRPPIKDLEDLAAFAEVLEPFCGVGRDSRASKTLAKSRRGANIRQSAQEYLVAKRGVINNKQAKVKVSGMRLAKAGAENSYNGLLNSPEMAAINNRNR